MRPAARNCRRAGNCSHRDIRGYNTIIMFIDYYNILGIEKNATPQDIKKAYRKLARKHHPDLNPNDKQAHKNFQQINEAHDVLSDPDKRKKYDQYGKDWQHADAFEQARQAQNQASNARRPGYAEAPSEGDFSDFFCIHVR